jgi:hypothetical protein
MKRREFIKNTTLGSVALSGLSMGLNTLNSDISLPKNALIKDRLWLWGQNPGSHHLESPEGGYKLPGTNLMDAREGCSFFGIEKCCRVTMSTGPFPPFGKEAEKIKDLKEVVWSAIGAGDVKQYENDQNDLDEVLRIAEIYPNITGAILDDFFLAAEIPGKSSGRHSLESISKISDRLHNFSRRRLDLWMVWYTYQLDFNVDDYIKRSDVLTLWTWKGSDLTELDSNIKKFVEKTSGKRRLAGCYMWNYGETKPLTMDQMKYQLDRYYYWLKKGDIEGIIFCSNCIADIGLDTVEYTRKWIAEVGNKRI